VKKIYALSLYGILGSLVFALDRLTKRWAVAHASSWPLYNDQDSLVSFDLVYNRGISWSMFHSSDDYQFAVVSGIIAFITLLVVIHAISWFRARRCIAGHVLVVAGSLSNIIDRYWYGGVIDFVHLHYGQWSWPIFNSADIGIVVGVVIIILISMRE